MWRTDRGRATSGLLLITAVALPSIGVGDAPPPGVASTAEEASDVEARASDAFERGKAFYKQEKYSDAAEAFREAQRLNPTWRLLFNIGQSEAAAKRFGLALEAFEAYLAKGGDEVSAERQQMVQNEVRRIREMVGLIDIKAPQGALIQIDGVDRGESPLPGAIPVTAGVIHTVSAILEGEMLPDKEVKVIGGATAEVSWIPENPPVKPAPIAMTPAQQTAPSAPPKRNTQRGVGIATAGAGGLVVVGGILTGAMALVKDGKLKKDCDDGACGAALRGTLESRDSLATATNVLLAVGGVAVAAGVVLFVIGVRKERQTAARFRPKLSGAGAVWEF